MIYNNKLKSDFNNINFYIEYSYNFYIFKNKKFLS